MAGMPTGEEPPKGMEAVFEKQADTQAITIDCVTMSQLAAIEKKEIYDLYMRTSRYIREVLGLEKEPLDVDKSLNLVPPGKDLTDKLAFRAYSGKYLVGYAPVVCGWPKKNEWTILAFILDPNYRDRGIGTAVLHKIERYAQNAKLAATCMVAIPTKASEDNFWNKNGYHDEIAHLEWNIEGTPRDIIMLRKEIAV